MSTFKRFVGKLFACFFPRENAPNGFGLFHRAAIHKLNLFYVHVINQTRYILS